LILAKASGAEALPSAIRTDPVRVALGILNDDIIKAFKAKAAELLLTPVLLLSFHQGSFLLIFHSFSQDKVID
jgi:hypothetical protein